MRNNQQHTWTHLQTEYFLLWTQTVLLSQMLLWPETIITKDPILVFFYYEVVIDDYQAIEMHHGIDGCMLH